MGIVEEVNFEVEPGLRYTEEVGRVDRSLTVRDCFLRREGVEEAVSGLNVVSLRQRFGAVSVPCEGIGGVETLPQYRRQGYMGRLMKQVLKGMHKRVTVAFVSDAVEDLYEKFGFVTCVSETRLVFRVRHVERVAGEVERQGNGRLRAFSADDLPAMVELFNRENALRPGTPVRQPDWKRLIETETWRPGSEVVIFERDGVVQGYAIGREKRFGSPSSAYEVDELTAVDGHAARMLLVELAKRCWQMRLPEFVVYEPPDGRVGTVAREIGGRVEHSFSPSGGMMGMILDRSGLLEMLEPELQRRLARIGASTLHEPAFRALSEGEIVVDDGLLLRLQMGYWSWAGTLDGSMENSAERQMAAEAWFPGGQAAVLPTAFTHQLDRY